MTFQQNLLRGFGIAVNSRTIRVSQLNVKASALNFKTQVSNTVNQVLNLYYALSAGYEDIKAKSNAVEVAQKFYQNSGLQERAGTLARLDVTTAESQLATAQYDSGEFPNESAATGTSAKESLEPKWHRRSAAGVRPNCSAGSNCGAGD